MKSKLREKISLQWGLSFCSVSAVCVKPWKAGVDLFGHLKSSFADIQDLCFSRKYNSQVVSLVVNNLPANAGDVRDVGSIPGSGRSSGEGHSNPLQYSSLENPMNRGDWRATVHGVIKSWT